MALHPKFPQSPHAILNPDVRWFPADETLRDITTSEITHTTILDSAGVADYRSVIGYFAQTVMQKLRQVSGYDVLYGKIKTFVQTELFDQTVELEHPNTLRNLSELPATKALIETFKKAINALTVQDTGGGSERMGL